MPIVDLTPMELNRCDALVVEREAQSNLMGFKNRHGLAGGGKTDPKLANEMGAQAECALARFTNTYWSGAMCPKQRGDMADVGFFAEVRCRRSSWQDLLVRSGDPKDRPYVLAVYKDRGQIDLVGWIRGTQMKQEWWKDPNGFGAAWWVPQDALNKDFTELEEVIRAGSESLRRAWSR